MAQIPSTTPAEIRAGDTVQFTRTHSDYLASAGWVLGFTLISGTAVFTFAGVADGDGFTVTVPAATTATWPAGSYKVQETVTLAGVRHTVRTTALRVLANLAAITTGGLETRTHAKKVLDALEAWIESKSPTAASFELAGRKLQNYPLGDLLAFRDRYRAEVNREARAEAGLGPARILVRL